MSKKKKDKEKQVIAEVKQYVDNFGRSVKVYEPMDGSDYVVAGQAAIQMPEGFVNVEFRFPEGTTMEKAFDDFDRLAEKAKGELEQRRSKQQAMGQDSKIVIPGGRIPQLDLSKLRFDGKR